MSIQMDENPIIADVGALQTKLGRANRDLAVLYEISNAMRTTLDLALRRQRSPE